MFFNYNGCLTFAVPKTLGYVRGFGSFINKKRAKKIARNISKNTAIVIDEHYIPAFKPSKVFVEKIKNSKKIKELAPQD